MVPLSPTRRPDLSAGAPWPPRGAIHPPQELPLPPFLDPSPSLPAAEASLVAFLQDAAADLGHWLATAGSRGPLPAQCAPLEPMPQRHGLPTQQLLADLQRVMDGAYSPNHPGALAHLDPPPLSAAIAAEMVCAGLNNNLLAEELSPGLSRLERDLCRWFARSLGMPPAAGGVPASGGSLSNLMALVIAREARGLADRREAVVLCSADAHVSLDKAVMVMGLPPSALLRLPVDGQGRLESNRVADTLGRLAGDGIPVIAVVATAGTTVRGAIDPLAELADLCRERHQWLHVDGAIGAVFALGRHPLHALSGLGRADSLTVNPQKLLGIPKTSSLLLLADPRALGRTFATGLPYMEPADGGDHGGEAGLQGTRPAEILKLWLGLRQLGLEGIQGLLDGALERCRLLERLLEPAADHLQPCGGPLHLLAFTPRAGDAVAAEAWSQRTRMTLLEANLMLSRPLHHGRRHLKAVLGNPHTRPSDLEQLAQIVIDSLNPR